MIRHKCNFCFVKNRLYSEFFKLSDCYRTCNVISQYKIEIRHNQISGFYRSLSRSLRQNLLGHGHSHNNPPFRRLIRHKYSLSHISFSYYYTTYNTFCKCKFCTIYFFQKLLFFSVLVIDFFILMCLSKSSS